jgi:metal-responsive CopG/Arc/MetJ family transcriptional regulator
MKTKKITNVSFQTTIDLRNKLDAMAKASGLTSRSRYIVRVLEKAVADSLIVREEASYSSTPPTARLSDEAAA